VNYIQSIFSLPIQKFVSEFFFLFLAILASSISTSNFNFKFQLQISYILITLLFIPKKNV